MSTAEARRHYARLLMAAADCTGRRLEDAFAEIPREDFVGPGPWTIVKNGRRIVTPSDDPHYIYSNTLVALDDERNNGEPLLHVMWMARIAPKPGETAVHIGAGTGYYTAILARLVEPGGQVTAYEIDPALARRAQASLRDRDDIEVIEGDAVKATLPPCDIIYVNAGVTAPPLHWLDALRQGGRMVFPWRPSERIGLALAVTRQENGYTVDPFMNSWFIPCVGASGRERCVKQPSPTSAKATRSLWLTAEREPDETATAIYDHVWFSESPLPERDADRGEQKPPQSRRKRNA